MQITISCLGRSRFRNGSMPAERPRKRAHNRHQLLSLTTTESKQKEREKWWPSSPLISKGFLRAFTREVILSEKPSREAVCNKNTSLQQMLCFTPSVFLAESLLKWHLVLVTCLSPLRLQKEVWGEQRLKIHQENTTAIKNNWHLLATASDTKRQLYRFGEYGCLLLLDQCGKEERIWLGFLFTLPHRDKSPGLCPAKYAPA